MRTVYINDAEIEVLKAKGYVIATDLRGEEIRIAKGSERKTIDLTEKRDATPKS